MLKFSIIIKFLKKQKKKKKKQKQKQNEKQISVTLDQSQQLKKIWYFGPK